MSPPEEVHHTGRQRKLLVATLVAEGQSELPRNTSDSNEIHSELC